MAVDVVTGPHPNIRIMRITGDLRPEDMANSDKMLGLDSNQPVYVVMDISKMNIGMPEHFLEAARHGKAVNHANMHHMAVYTTSDLLINISKMVAKVNRQQSKLSIHETYDAAISHLQTLIAQA